MYTPVNPDKKRVTFGKHKGKTFAHVYTMKHYVKWVLDVVNATGKLRELQEYFAENEGIVLPPAPKKMYKTEPPWFVGVREVWDEVADPNNWRDGEYHGFAD